MLVDEGERFPENSNYLSQHDVEAKDSNLAASGSTERRKSRDCFEGIAALGLKDHDRCTSGREACSRALLALGCDSGNQSDC